MANSCTSPESTSSSIDSSPTQHDSGLLLSDGAYDSYLTNYPMENYVDPSGKTHETFMYVPGGASEQMAPTYPSSSYHHPSSQIYPPASIQYSPASSAYSSSTQYSAPQWDSDQDIKPFLSPDLAERLEYAPYQTIHGDPQTPQNQSGYSPVVAHSSWQAGGYTYQ
ncbi:hypothetical protein BT69DRAFT_1333407 [Atractiella rhizophila]|nr:hypothetical protein BT69DRAFT_1333407 [Atractiella rhizophila]